MTGWRAAGRIAACVLHGLHALAVVLVRFRSLDAPGRHASIRWWAATLLERIGVELRLVGTPAEGAVLLVSNHVSWLDILAIHAVCPRASFVSKADIQHWPLISRLAAAADTIFLERERKRDARRVVDAVADALRAGRLVAVFPEGTTGDGRSLLPFHANLLQAAIATGTPVQPMTVRYSDAADTFSRAVEFVGATTLAQSVWRVACADRLVVHVTLLAPQDSASAQRRELAGVLRQRIAGVLEGVVDCSV